MSLKIKNAFYQHKQKHLTPASLREQGTDTETADPEILAMNIFNGTHLDNLPRNILITWPNHRK